MVQEDILDKDKKLKNIQKEIDQYVSHLSELKKIENDSKKCIMQLTAMRETMARKASTANAEVRECGE
jgi:septation ring formation regulator EzrA